MVKLRNNLLRKHLKVQDVIFTVDIAKKVMEKENLKASSL